MTTENNNQAGAGTVPVGINSQYIKDLSFENPNAPQSFMSMKTAPNVEVNVNVEAKKMNEELFEVTLHVKANAKSEKDTIFIAELSYAALVSIQGLSDENLKPILLIEVPRIIFPFARNILADVTRDGGYPPLMINPVDFVTLYRRSIEESQKARNSSAGSA